MSLNPLGNMGNAGRPPQNTSVSEGEFKPATIESCRIINVNIESWSVDVIAEHGNKRFFDLQVMSPYFHFVNGEGIYAQPEVGAMCWVCVPSAGRFAAPFVLGFQSAHDQDLDSFQGGRQALNPGDIMLRTRDENFLVLRRGGVVQIGATPVAQRIFLPIRNFIKDFCENYGLYTFGGELTWETARTDETNTADTAFSKFSLMAKEKAGNKNHIANLSIGSHGESSKTTLLLEIFDSGDEGNRVMISLAITKEGDVAWQGEKGYAIEMEQNIQITSNQADVTIKAVMGSFTAQSKMAALMKSETSDATVSGKTQAVLHSDVKDVLDAPLVQLGAGGASPVVKGDMLVSFLTALITQISQFSFIGTLAPVPGPPVPVIAAPAVAALIAQLPTLLSTTSFTK